MKRRKDARKSFPKHVEVGLDAARRSACATGPYSARNASRGSTAVAFRAGR
jgi:hypothetical protein